MVKQLLSLLFVTSYAFSQASDYNADTTSSFSSEIENFKTIGVLQVDNRFVASCSQTSDKYIVVYSNIENKNSENQKIEFVGKESIDDLYNSIISGFHGLDEYSGVEYRKQIIIFNSFQVGVLDIFNYNSKVQLTFRNRNGNVTKSEWLTKNQVNSLFGV